MNNKYPSFVNDPSPKIDYDCKELKADKYQLRARCNKNNPDCEKFIQEKRNEGFDVRIVELDASLNVNNKNMTDIWVKKD